MVYNDFAGDIVHLWSNGDGNWFFDMPVQATSGIAARVNVATGMSAFAWAADATEHIVYVGQDGHIYELTVKQGSAMSNLGLPWTATDITALVESDPRYSPPVMAQE